MDFDLEQLQLHFVQSEEDFYRLKFYSDKIWKYNLSIEGKLTLLMSLSRMLIDFPPGKFKRANSTFASKIINHGMGLCGDYCRIFVALAYARGFDGRLIGVKHSDGINGHVIAEVKVNENWIAFDPTFLTVCRCDVYTITDEPKEPYRFMSAYDWWKHPEIVDQQMNRGLWGWNHLGMSWKELMHDFHVVGKPTIRQLGEETFLRRFYGLDRGQV